MIKERRETAAIQLNRRLPSKLYRLEKDGHIIKDDLDKIRNMGAEWKNKGMLPTDLL